MIKNKSILIALSIILLLIILVVGVFLYISSTPEGSYALGLILRSFLERDYDFEYINAPDNSIVTLMYVISNRGISYYDSNIYVIPGRYNKKEVPKDGNYLKLGNGAAIYFEWTLNTNGNGTNIYTLKVFSDSDPEVNNFKSDTIKIEFVNDYKIFDKFREEGTPVRRYQLFK